MESGRVGRSVRIALAFWGGGGHEGRKIGYRPQCVGLLMKYFDCHFGSQEQEKS